MAGFLLAGHRVRFQALAGVAQLVEHQLPKLRVAGSNPVARLKAGRIAAGFRFPPDDGPAPTD